MTPKAVPAAPLGLLAIQCHADADVEAAAAIVAPTRYRVLIPDHMALPTRGSLFKPGRAVEELEVQPRRAARSRFQIVFVGGP
jgi:hypothetical protein